MPITDVRWNAQAVKLTIRSHGASFEIVDGGAEWRVAIGRGLLDPGVPAPLRPGTVIASEERHRVRRPVEFRPHSDVNCRY